MRRVALTAAVLFALVAVAAAAARNPLDEREQLRAADNRAAKATLVRLDDLVGGWKQTAPKPDTSDDDFTCPGVSRPNLSRFVITGKAEAEFKHGYDAIHAETQIMASRAHAVGDFTAGVRAFTARCLRYAFEHQFGKPDPDISMAVSRVQVSRAARYGERSIRFQVEATVSGAGATLRWFNDFVVFQKGRALGVVYASSLRQPLDAADPLARVMLSRMR